MACRKPRRPSARRWRFCRWTRWPRSWASCSAAGKHSTDQNYETGEPGHDAPAHRLGGGGDFAVGPDRPEAARLVRRRKNIPRTKTMKQEPPATSHLPTDYAVMVL